jgi:hypothetical protein
MPRRKPNGDLPWDSVKAIRRDVGERLTARTEITPDPTEFDEWAAFMKLHSPGGIWRAVLEPMRAWAEREADGDDMTPHRGTAWIAKGLLQDWRLMQQAQRNGCFDSFAVALWSFAKRWNDRVDIDVIEPDWERGRRNREHTSDGGKATRKLGIHLDRWRAVHNVRERNPGLSARQASEHAARQHPELGRAESMRKSYSAEQRKLGKS